MSQRERDRDRQTDRDVLRPETFRFRKRNLSQRERDRQTDRQTDRGKMKQYLYLTGLWPSQRLN